MVSMTEVLRRKRIKYKKYVQINNNTTDNSRIHNIYNISNYNLNENISIDVNDYKIAFMFLTRGPMPFEDIWREFFTWRANKSHFNIYIHAAFPGFK